MSTVPARVTATLAVLALAGAPAAAQGGAPRDSAVTLRGLLQIVAGDGGRPTGALLTLERPLPLGASQVGTVSLAGDLRRLAQSDAHFVQVTGTLAVGAPAGGGPLPEVRVSRVREAEAEGTVHRNLSRNMNEMVLVTLAVVPGRVSWLDSSGTASLTTPAALFTITNMSKYELQPVLPTTNLVCVTVTPPGGNAPAWRYAWERTEASTYLMIKIGATFRSLTPLPPDAARLPGRHTVRVTLCGLDEYAVEAPLEVVGKTGG